VKNLLISEVDEMCFKEKPDKNFLIYSQYLGGYLFNYSIFRKNVNLNLLPIKK